VIEFANQVLEVDQFDLVFAFASFHHIPGQGNQIQILQKIHRLLHVDGRFVHSNWQFLNSDKLRKRIQPWSMIGLRVENVDPGDYLLDWRRGGHGLRYVHHFNQDELITLAEKTGFQVVETFYSDGEGGRLGLYQVWERHA
jgi:SAM-dependent methyltransferase